MSDEAMVLLARVLSEHHERLLSIPVINFARARAVDEASAYLRMRRATWFDTAGRLTFVPPPVSN
jgi:hypothetical protein